MGKYITESKKTLLWLVLSNIVKSLSQWGILVILVKFFPAESVGYYTLGLAITAPIFMLSDMQLKSVLVVEPETGFDNFAVYQIIRLISTGVATTGLIIYNILFQEINWIIFAVIIYKAMESLIDILYGYLQKKDKMVWMSKSDIVKTFLSVLVCFLVTMWLHRIVTSLISIVFVSIMLYVIDCIYIKGQFVINIDKASLKKILEIVKKSFPLGISVLFTSYITNYPRITIEGYCGPEMLAYFGAYSYLVIGIFQIQTPIQTFLRQRLSKNFHNSNVKAFKSKVNRTIVGFIAIGFLFLVSFYFVGNTILKVLYKETYIEYSDVIYYLIGAQLLMSVSSIYATAILSFNIYTKQAFISFGIFIIVFLCSRFLISNYGIYGGGYISIIAAVVSVICYMSIYLNRLNKWQAEN
ncbi:lipopolysaccharide biosynthesis protein [Butyricimonas paravirosa]